MRLFGSSRRVQPKTFTYVPQYYDEKKERLENLLKDANAEDEESTAAMKARIKMGFTSRPYYYDKQNSASKIRRQSNIRVLLIFAILLIAAVIYLGKNSKAIFELAQ